MLQLPGDSEGPAHTGKPSRLGGGGKVPPSQGGADAPSSGPLAAPRAAGAAGGPGVASELGPAGLSIPTTRPPGRPSASGQQRRDTNKCLSTLAPFVPKLLKDQVVQDDARYRGFDGGEDQDLAAASGRMQPVMQERHMSMMIADVKGFTKLTEILSKKGGRAGTGGAVEGDRGWTGVVQLL